MEQAVWPRGYAAWPTGCWNSWKIRNCTTSPSDDQGSKVPGHELTPLAISYVRALGQPGQLSPELKNFEALVRFRLPKFLK